ncbi:repressible alkaline phosphatase [Nannizzia gypsea CBS 118893]|uniref:Alkaline phosphatase n=1 Tax=Arthroderma gypseum (strain ATCC MYA-4604 / CBS 118893) TaxID=535722 RepID=E4UP36_ARTGP|nr:repressible alkaline phosphatase [Nannizzia gypsea CBS 118893]EFQ98978.1 repressible alkaline phosphatase [Nannizzia gypsea CBS 118893]
MAPTHYSRRRTGLFSWSQTAAAAAIAIVTVMAVLPQAEASEPAGEQQRRDIPSGKRNVILMVSDGMGPQSVDMARNFRQWQTGTENVLWLDGYLIGQSRTRSSNSAITDSAAGATAFSCGKKTYNGAIAVLPDGTPCGTVLEGAKAAGYKTGLVATTRITDATPAVFAAHANSRSYEDLIAEQEIGEHPLGRQLDLLLGGGRCHFLPGRNGGCRDDNKDIIRLAQSKGFSYVGDRRGFDGLNGGASAKLPLIGLFADGNIPFEIDRRYQNDVYPSLEEMTRTALKALSDATRNSDQGFFIMIEGSRIDHAGHGNDPAAQVHEVVAFDRAFAAVLEFLEKDSTPGILISTSDHETGGLSAGRARPNILGNASHSAEYLGKVLESYGGGRDVAHQLVEEGLGIHDASDREIDSVARNGEEGFAKLISQRAQVGWTTGGHTPANVNIYASSRNDASSLVGTHENTEIGNFLAGYLRVDLNAITRRLRGIRTTPRRRAAVSDASWMGKPLSKEDIENLKNAHNNPTEA